MTHSVTYVLQVKTGGGFGGTGFKFDEAEAQYTTEKKKFQKAALGLQVQFQKAVLSQRKCNSVEFKKRKD